MGSKTKAKVGWMRVHFGDVVRLVRDRVDPETSGIERYVAGEHMDTNDIRIRRWGEVGDGYLGPAFHMRFKPGHVLYGSRRTYLRKVALADFEGICANTTFVLESADPSVLLPELLPYVMQTETFHDHSIKQSKGSVNPYVNFSDLVWYEFDLPSIGEQRRISHVAHALSLHREAVVAVGGHASAVTEAMILQATQDAPLIRVGDLLKQGPQNGVSPAVRDQGAYPTISIGAIRNGVVDTLNNLKRADLEEDKYRRFILQPGDILCVRGNGNRDLVGRCGMVTTNPHDCFFPDLLIRIGFDQDRIMPAFAVAAWNAVAIHSQLIVRAKSTNGIYKINGGDIREHRLPVPSLAVQQTLLEQLRHMGSAVVAVGERFRSTTWMQSRFFEQLAT